MDFVHSASGEPVNSPFEYVLWGVPETKTPWLSMSMSQRIRSIEHTHSIRQEDILPGHEKFILRDGLTRVLIRPGKSKIQSNVPVRSAPPAPEAASPNFIDFPVAMGEVVRMRRLPVSAPTPPGYHHGP
ncbi:hypothetical protein BV20DRAFT_1051496 [Pilatotrama ljubarskyi]|nr:hypothetical protein BV20DRAFT_1051496 [Pilatotrama ljubarskyi]